MCIVTGPYGSGKTEFCVNLARKIAEDTGRGVTIADLDVINPYFRSREKAEWLAAKNITVMGDCLDNNTGQDLPAVSYAFLSRVRRGENVIIDLAGGENGLKLLASCYSAIESCPKYEFLCVLNLFRKETASVAKMVNFVHRINNISLLPVTGLVSNGHMLRDTTAEHVLESEQAAIEASRMLGVPLGYTMLRRDIYDGVRDKLASERILVFDKPTMREDWQ
ncbi:MAG: hypothetical protein FWC93_06755 [Defluviitaleaceae bacterium]|nr:hypothetical protein [Defluviitaleaceae bacterium]